MFEDIKKGDWIQILNNTIYWGLFHDDCKDKNWTFKVDYIDDTTMYLESDHIGARSVLFRTKHWCISLDKSLKIRKVTKYKFDIPDELF